MTNDLAIRILNGDILGTTEQTHEAVAMAVKALSALPSSDVQPVRYGRWEREEDPYGFFDTIPVCSACGCTTKYRVTSAYCPNCGAKMDEVT